MRFVFKRNSDQFVIMTNEPDKNMKLKIMKIYLTARIRSLESPLFVSLAQNLRNKDAIYEFIRYDLVKFQCPQENTNHSFTLFQKTVPHTVLIFFNYVDSAAGSYSLNPFEVILRIMLIFFIQNLKMIFFSWSILALPELTWKSRDKSIQPAKLLYRLPTLTMKIQCSPETCICPLIISSTRW